MKTYENKTGEGVDILADADLDARKVRAVMCGEEWNWTLRGLAKAGLTGMVEVRGYVKAGALLESGRYVLLDQVKQTYLLGALVSGSGERGGE